MSTTHRVAIVGCGAIAEAGHLPALLAHPRFEVVALCDNRAERTAALARLAPGVETVNDYRALLGRGDIDAVILALHPEVSVDVAIAFLRDGKPVLDEKPLATNLADARRLMGAVDESGVVYQIGFVFGDCDFVRAVRPYAQRIGTPAIYRVCIYDEVWNPADTEHFARLQGGLRYSSAVTHEGSHVVDFVRRWNPSSYTHVFAHARATHPSLQGPNLWSAQLAMADGSLLSLEIAWLLHDMMPSELRINGPGGALRMELFTGRGDFRHGGNVEVINVPIMAQAWARQLDGFADAIDSGQSLACPIERGWDALVATQACERANASQTVVQIADVAASA